MTNEQYTKEKDDLLKKRLALFKKMHKIDNRIKKLDDEYLLSIVPYKKGDCFIVTSSEGVKHYFRVKEVKINSIKDNQADNISLKFDNMSERWTKLRKGLLDLDWGINLNRTNNFDLPINDWAYTWKKIND